MRRIRPDLGGVAERAEALRRSYSSVDAVYTIVDRDRDIGGGIMAASLAYRLFIWLLPFSLVVIGGIGVTSDVASESPASAARSLGLHGLVSNSVAQAAQGSSRWYALLIGIPLLVWATRTLLTALVVVHRLVWGDLRRAAPKGKLAAPLGLLVLLLGYFVIREFARAVESWSGSVVLGTLLSCLGLFAWWLALSARLPHRDAPWHALIPGAIIVAVGLQLIAMLGTYVIAQRVASSQSAYGTLGVAATVLFGLYVLSRLVVASAMVNGSIWERASASA
jgi:membrane protein